MFIKAGTGITGTKKKLLAAAETRLTTDITRKNHLHVCITSSRARPNAPTAGRGKADGCVTPGKVGVHGYAKDGPPVPHMSKAPRLLQQKESRLHLTGRAYCRDRVAHNRASRGLCQAVLHVKILLSQTILHYIPRFKFRDGTSTNFLNSKSTENENATTTTTNNKNKKKKNKNKQQQATKNKQETKKKT